MSCKVSGSTLCSHTDVPLQDILNAMSTCWAISFVLITIGIVNLMGKHSGTHKIGATMLTCKNMTKTSHDDVELVTA